MAKIVERNSLNEIAFGCFCLFLAFRFERTQWLMVFPMISILVHSDYSIFMKNNKPNIYYRQPLYFYIFLQMLRFQIPQMEMMPVQSIIYWNENSFGGNVYCKWTWSGYVHWHTNGTAKTFVDTRIEPFNRTEIELAIRAQENVISYLGDLARKGTEYLLLENLKFKKQLGDIIKSNLAIVLYRNDKEILLKLNIEKVRELYGNN